MRYKNIKTGAIVDSPCLISGGDWVDMEKLEDEELEDKDVEDKDENFNKITAKEIKQELDNFEIEYDSKSNKKELYDLMIQGR